jgi:toxin ParE1/3/4
VAVRLTPRAQIDIQEIWDYTRDRWGVAQAERYVGLIRDIAVQTAEDPRRGKPCDDIRPGYFKITAGSHVLFYRLEGDDFDVVRILHGRMDFNRHL